MNQQKALSKKKLPILPSLVSTLLSLMVLLPTPSRANVLLGIVQDTQNANEWNQIIKRIRILGISYEPIDLRQINTLADLSGLKVIFLPNTQTLTQTQVQVLEEWVKQGGKLIASGQVGKRSQPGVRQKLRSLLGSYWAFPLNQPTTPEPKYRCLDITCKESTSWAPKLNNQSTVAGGVLIPAGLSSTTVATWKGSSGSSAVVMTPQATYLGWHWGNSATLDSIWLQAILNRYQNQLQFSARNNNPFSVENNRSTLPTANNSNPIKIQPRTTPSNISTKENVNPVRIQPRTTPVNTAENSNINPTVNQDNIWLISQPEKITTDKKPEHLTQATERLGSHNSNLGAKTTTAPKSETVSEKDTPVSSPENLPSETTNNKGENIWHRLSQQKEQQNRQSEAVTDKDTIISSSYNLTPQNNNRGTIWNQTPQEAKTSTSSSRRNPITALLRPLPLPQIQVPNSQADPSSESAPPGLDIRQGSHPISRAEANAMLQELNNLLGRFESALVAAKSANVEVNLAVDDISLVAANTDNTTFIAQRNQKNRDAQQVITRARQVIQNFPQQVKAKQYAMARNQWLQTRQMLWNNYPTDGQRAGAEIRAVWLDRGTIVRARSERGLVMVFDRLAAAGINTVFFETINAGYTIYPSNVAPKQNPLTISWDPLKVAVKLAHERNMELHAWIWTFAVGNQAHNRALGQVDSYLGPLISANPSWVMTDNKGRKRHPADGKVYIDPANPEVRQYLRNIIDEIASRYQVDGIQLDYIRYPFQDPRRNFSYGYSATARHQFRQLYGIDPMKISPRDRQNLWKWTEFKINQVNSFVTNTSNFLKGKYPNLILSVAVFPFPRNERFHKIQQDWETWVLNGDIDLLTPMTYALDTNRFQQITQPLTNTGVLGSTLITPAVKLLNIPEIIAVDQIQAARDLPTGGYIIFAAERITGGLHGFLTRTQGKQETDNNRRAALSGFAQTTQVVEGVIPYRQPFTAAADRFQALKKEWSFLLGNKQLFLGESQLESWRNEAGELATALEKLADHPDYSNLNNARRSLRKFQLKFRSAMSAHSRQNAYQVQTWQNRLAALEMFLNYGERVKLNSKRF
ncbi:MAG: family 10 glycosylhydrolase [Trichodesmium sp. MAG_R03]|nr:family 10 glycosylhydrolase [Trichodesmium sp. MAG_R03]